MSPICFTNLKSSQAFENDFKRRSTFLFKHKEPKLEILEGLISDLNAIKRGDFRRDHGGILSLLIENVDYGVINTLAQYYDPPLRCFMFSDFQLDPTLEEVERIMDQKLKDFYPFPKLKVEVNLRRITLVLSIDVKDVIDKWTKRVDFKGFAKRFLE